MFLHYSNNESFKENVLKCQKKNQKHPKICIIVFMQNMLFWFWGKYIYIFI